MKVRFLHKLFANAFGYFWLPCPDCGEVFGGHETGDRSVSVGHGMSGRILCPRCSERRIHGFVMTIQPELPIDRIAAECNAMEANHF